ncbi:energy transducer TonB [Methylophaga sp. SB9B]|uniref:energy transducer TonB n=1 Tax=Methylophaga sp. SB9B TaxID=2570356 RepID=UPI0010A8E704|nr:energy transducer TonB [Methylophaga sp. SB9B]THK43148.1 energy transducer TonB [Methylophaga sp. SB9B]
MIKFRYWLLAIFSAMSIHVFAFGMYTIKHPHLLKPVPPVVEAGITIDISMLDATTMAKQQAAAAAEPMTNIDEQTTITEVQERNNDPVQIEQKPTKTETKKPLQQTDIKKAVNTAPAIDKLEPNPKTSENLAATTEPAEHAAANSEKQLENTQIAEQGEAAESSTISSQAASAIQQAAQQTYFSLLARTLAEKKRYPGISRRRGEQGVVQLFFIVSRDGKIRESRIDASSGFQRLDQAVMEMLEKAQPLPAFPAEMSQQQLEVKVPIAFELSS